jgi:two-component system response regulator VanR
MNYNLKSLKNYTILIVDDDMSILNDLKTIMEFFFCNILTATNGKEALEIFKVNSVDLIFTDYVMPSIDGCQLARQIREQNSTIPIVVLSSHSDKDKLLSLIDLNLSGFIIKPFSFEDINKILIKISNYFEKQNNDKFYISKEVVFDIKLKQIYKNDEQFKLTKNELLLIELFIQNQNKLVTDDMITVTLDNTDLSYQAIKNIIYRLRKKIGKDFIKNVQSLGYIFNKKD